VDWSTAFARCSALNSHLAVINNANEQQIIVQLLKALSATDASKCSGWYTAGQRTDPSTKSAFVWKLSKNDGSTGFTVVPLSYTNWIPGQPDFWQSKESCMDMQKDNNYGWNDLTCDSKVCFICQIDL
jgi:hypothetical protein